MQFLLFGFLILLAFIYIANKYKKAAPKDILYSMRWLFVGAVLLFVLFLITTGKAQLIWLGFLSLLPWVRRFFMAKSFYKFFTQQKSNEDRGSKGAGEDSEKSGPISRIDAYHILGLTPSASDDDIRKAHRDLMKRHHPDTGGDVELAAKINRAKDILLS